MQDSNRHEGEAAQGALLSERRDAEFEQEWLRCSASIAIAILVAVLRGPRSGGLQLFCADRLLWAWLYRNLAAGLARDGAGEARDGRPVATQGLPALLAVAMRIAPIGRPKTSNGN